MCAEPAIYAVCNHVQDQSNRNHARFGMKKQQKVNHYHRVAVQRMKTNAAAARIKHRIGEQVIEVDRHREQHQQICLQPRRPEKQQGNKHRKSQVQEIMNQGLHDHV